MMIKDMGPQHFVFDSGDVNHPDIDRKMATLKDEMREVYHLY